MNDETWGIKHRATGQFFSGFDSSGNAVWSEYGVGMSKDAACAQAILLAKADREVQRKPALI